MKVFWLIYVHVFSWMVRAISSPFAYFVEPCCESVLENGFPDTNALFKTNLENLIGSNNFSVWVIFPNSKGFSYSYESFCSLHEGETSFCSWLVHEISEDLFCFHWFLLYSVSSFFSLSTTIISLEDNFITREGGTLVQFFWLYLKSKFLNQIFIHSFMSVYGKNN